MVSKDIPVAANKKRKNFKWPNEIIEDLADCILNYKIKCNFS